MEKIKKGRRNKVKFKGHKIKKVKKEKNNSWIISLILMFLMTGSIFGYIMVYYNSDNYKNTFTYNEHKFIVKNNIYYPEDIKDKTLQFHYSPKSLENISLDQNIIRELLDGNTIYTTFDPNTKDKETFDLIRFELFQSLNSVSAITKPSIDYNNIPVLTCQNTTGYYKEGNTTKTFQRNIILLELGNETKITLKNKCVILEARNKNDLMALKDRLVYGLYNIIPNN